MNPQETLIQEIQRRSDTTIETVCATNQAEDDRATLLQIIKVQTKALKAYEAWEASLLETSECWDTNSSFPIMNRRLYDRWMELQIMRNEALYALPIPERKE